MRAPFVIALLFGFHCAFGQQPSGEEILRKAEENFHGIRDYTVSLDIIADIERMKVPPMHATMYFKQPEKVHFDAQGVVFLPREGMGVQFGQLTRRYAVDSVAREVVNGAHMHRLALHPRDDKAVIRRMFMWIDGKRWTPERLRMPRADGRVLEAHLTYARIDQFWLPSRLVVTFTVPERDTTSATPGTNPFARELPVATRGSTRTGTVTVNYTGYRVNTGLPDSLFDSDQRK
jgi:outer membrane lipoprotein-sorting protein